MRLHRRQFVIGPDPVLVDDGWTSTPVGNGLLLSHDRALPVETARDRQGGAWHLLGIAVQSDPDRASPLTEIASAPPHEIEGLSSAWSGRWALLGRETLRTDACGLLGCFYGRRTSDGRLLASSSPALMRDWVREGAASPPVRHERGMDWYPPPASRFPGITRLLPSQTLALAGGEPLARYRPLQEPPLPAPYDATLARLERSFRTALRNLADRGSLWLALTAGYDSRVLLAALWREQLDFTAFTLYHPAMSRADRVIPRLLAKDAGIPHMYIPQFRFDEQRLQAFDAHVAAHTNDRDREFFAWNQWEQLPARALVLRANVFALGATYYHRKLPARPSSIAAAVEQAFGFAQHHRGSPAHWSGTREWARWIEAHPEPLIDWRDRFYWEQRGAGWTGALEQGLDLVGIESVNPVSCGSIVTAMLSIDPTKRYRKVWEADLAYRMAPFTSDHPYAVGGPLATRLRRNASDWARHPRRRRFPIGRLRSLVMRAAGAGTAALSSAGGTWLLVVSEACSSG
jgi:hypothetical protein